MEGGRREKRGSKEVGGKEAGGGKRKERGGRWEKEGRERGKEGRGSCFKKIIKEIHFSFICIRKKKVFAHYFMTFQYWNNSIFLFIWVKI